MANVTGPRVAGLSAAIANTGGDNGGSYANGGLWTNAGNGAAADGVYATAVAALSNISTDQLKASTFGFNLPSQAVILGIFVEYTLNNSGAYTYTAQLPKGASKSTSVVTGGLNGFGGPTDLWGATWTAADINASTFGSTYQMRSYNSTGFNAYVDSARITVYWDYPALPNGTIQKYHQYQAYRQGIYLGLIPNVTTEFAYSQDINTAGTQIIIASGISGDTSGYDAPTIDDEFGVPLQTEAGANLQTERFPDIIGNSNSKGLFRNGNQIIVTEFSNYHPNGIVVFSGDVQRWNTVFGGIDGDQVVLTVYSDGGELNNFIMTGGDTIDQSQLQANGLVTDTEPNDKLNNFNRYGQTFVIGAGITNLEAISIYSQGGANITLKIYSSIAAANAGNAPLATVTRYMVYAAAATELQFVFSPVISVTPAQSLFFALSTDVSGINFYYTSSDLYSGGTLVNASYGGGSGGGAWGAIAGDLLFKSWYGGNSTTITYTSSDPTNMLIDAVNRYNSKGGIIKVAAGSTDLTARSITYKFSVATLFEGIQKCLELAPYNWYWYVDIGLNTLYFKQTSTTAKYNFIKGKHYSSLNLSATTENVKNLLYFTGGIPSGTTNLFSTYSDQASIVSNKQKVDRQTDNRVTIQGTADALGTSFINSVKNENYETSITILDTTMDISLFRVGDTVGFAGNGNFIDGLILQVARIDYTPSQAILTLGQLPPRVNQTLRDIEQSLTDLETLANPTTPT